MDNANKKAKDLTNALVFGAPENEADRRPPETIELLNELTKKLFDTGDIENKTELKGGQLIKFALARTYAQQFGVTVIDDILQFYSVYAISKDRKSREEFTKLASSLTGYTLDNERGGRSLPEHLMGVKS